MKSAQAKIPPNFVLDGRYEMLEALGQGGMAHVYLAYDRDRGNNVAVKLMRDELSDDPEFIRRFATEARAAASLDHPNIVKVLDYGQDGDIRYIVQEYVEGTNLKELIKEYGALSWDLAVPLMIQIGMGLEHAHRRGIIHRDMKPQNVLITPQMTAKVTDFGIARASIANTITLTGGAAFGSVHYFSPEQARGGAVTERSDLYSLGLMLYEMLTGKLPFDGDSSVAVAIKQLQEMPMRPTKVNPKIPPGLDIIIFKAIQKSPERRFFSAREFVGELDRFMHDPRAYFESFPPQAQNWSSSSAALTTDKGSSNYGKIEEIERNINRRRRSRLRDYFLTVVIVILAVIILGYIIKVAINNFSLGPDTEGDESIIVVERYIGQNISEVEDQLQQIYGDKYELIPVKSETQDKGVIFEQSPSYGTKLRKEDAHISLKYSVGKSEVIIDDVAGLTEDEARSRLESQGINPVLRREGSELIPAGNVIRTEPAAGDSTYEGARVLLFVSAGSERVLMPPLEGLSYAQAEYVLEERNLNLRGENVHYNEAGELEEPPRELRVVLRQKTDADTELRSGTTVFVEYGTQEDYQLVLQGIDLKEAAKKRADRDSYQQATLHILQPRTDVMPNLLGMTIDEVRAAMQYVWPQDAPAYSIATQGDAKSVAEAGVVVVRQSIPAGDSFNPYTDTLFVFFDYR